MTLRRARRLAAVLLVPLVLCGLAVRLGYPGMTTGLWNQMRYTSFAETRNLWLSVSYLLEFLQKLSWDPAAGMYNLRETPGSGLEDLDRGRLAFHCGEFARAAIFLDRHIARRGESEEALFWLALSTLRQAETENCLAALRGAHAGHPGAEPRQLCTLPLLRPHERRDPARRAMALFSRLVDRPVRQEADRRLYQWLLNLSSMAAGGFPDAVPARHRLQTPFIKAFHGPEAARVRRENADLRFVDRARELGVDNFGAGRGVAVEDFDGDGHPDLIATGLFGGVRYYRNQGGRSFVDATAGSGLEGASQPLTVSAADYDGDGWMDLFVVRPFDHYRLFANRKGRFVDVTRASGLLGALPEDTKATSWISTWGDVDNDGDLDLFLSGWAFRIPLMTGLPARSRLDSKLFLNERGQFRDATADLGLAPLLADRHYIGAAFGDVDSDGWLDLYIAGPLPSTSVLLRNRAGERFEKVFVYEHPGFTAAFVDVNHDGRLDIFQAGVGDARSAVAQAVFDDRRYRSGHSTILLQTAEGRFADHPEFFAGGMPMSTMGSSYGDLDNDGCLDFYLGTGNPEPWFILPNLMYRGEREGDGCSGRLRNISMLHGFGNLQKGHGIVFCDFDDDGDQDVYSSLGGMWPADQWPGQLFMNEGEGGNAWVKIRLRGRRSNRWGVGSMIEVRARAADGRPIVRTYHMDSKTGFGSAPYLAHVGLGRAERIEDVRVTWLGSGCVGTYAARMGELNVLDEAGCSKP